MKRTNGVIEDLKAAIGSVIDSWELFEDEEKEGYWKGKEEGLKEALSIARTHALAESNPLGKEVEAQYHLLKQDSTHIAHYLRTCNQENLAHELKHLGWVRGSLNNEQ